MNHDHRAVISVAAVIAVLAFGVSTISRFDSQSAATVTTQVSKDATTLTGKTGGGTKSLVPTSCNVYVVDAHNDRVQIFNGNGGYISKFGTTGSGNGQFFIPVGIAFDKLGNIYVTDQGNNRVQKFDSSGNYISQWGSYGSGNGQFNSPYGIALDSSNNVYTIEYGNNRVQKFDSSGNFILKWGSFGTGNGQFYNPEGITVDSFNNVYVADAYNDRIQKFDSSGNYIMQFGAHGTGNGQFFYPNGVFVIASGDIYVADTHNARVQKFDPSGNYLTQWGNGQFGSPYGAFAIAFDYSSNSFYVNDLSNNRIKKFDSNGNYILQWGSLGSGNGQFNMPQYMAIQNCAPDLVITSTSTPATISKTQINSKFTPGVPPYPVQINIDIKNIGNADAVIPSGTKLLYQMVNDATNIAANHGPTCSGCPSPLPYLTFGPMTIHPGDTYHIDTDSQFMWGNPMTLGNYHFSLFVDWPYGAPTTNGLVEESEETNNQYIQPFVVVP